ncbi:mechanosensitive ion channel-like protein [Halohasta litchfieldiae]|jgi:small-conductance mechanosensitive channel|uniref:Mechanosensitive ion channel n=1 Tax=Halohasta litchfieldiae TaxID=1073996 RepID=A0A1H6XSX3_9EURY|nr:mechanosensitive ion channel family protein [Halohasta litchfieldiae]ATW87350.1 mechanosensitive ion channel-like protein [Halohasta litchfieldiae]SEJ31296.1 Mechanosensitive ion channel [Halohasta litchfieldiae]
MTATAPSGAGTPLGDLLTNVGVPAGGTIGAALTFVISLLLVYAVGKLILLPLFGRMLTSRGLETHARRPLKKIAHIVMVFLAVSVAFGLAGFGNFLTSLATIAAAATLAVGFAMQDVLKNFVAGVFIFTDKPFKIGDWIEWEEYSGVVEDISFRVTRVRTFDNELLTVPNSTLTEDVVKNPVDGEKLRLQFLFGIGYDDDIDRATEIIIAEAENHPDVLDDPAPSVRLTELADSSVGLKSRIWISQPKRSDFVRTRAEYVKAVKQRFDEAGIDIPYPQRELSGDIEMAAPPEIVDASE